jgi:fimbrial isopeptide formation D2 family protein/uncharacterized repeat protein (TIGR01451 family)
MSWTAMKTTKRIPGSRRWSAWLLGLCLVFGLQGAFAATTASNTATIEPPPGVTDSSGGCDAAVPPNCTGDNISTVTVNIWAATATKSANPGTGAAVLPGSTITYTVTVDVTGVATTAPVVLNDTLGTGLTFGAVVTNVGGFTPNTASNPLVFTLPTGAAVGPHTITYTAIVATNATGTVGNSVIGTSNCTSAAPCTTNHTVGTIDVTKTGPVEPVATKNSLADPDELLTYTITITNNSDTAVGPSALPPYDHYGATDVLSAGLTYVSSSPSGTNVGATTTWADLSIGARSSVALTVIARVNNPIVVQSVTNLAKKTGDPDPPCPSGACTPPFPTASTATVTKSANPASNTTVAAGQLITYTLTVTVEGGNTDAPITLNDNLGPGLTYVGLATSPAINDGFTPGTAGSARTFSLPTGRPAGTYRVAYTATVNAAAVTGQVNNVVTGLPCKPAGTCTTNHPVGSVSLLKLLVDESIANDQVAQPRRSALARARTTHLPHRWRHVALRPEQGPRLRHRRPGRKHAPRVRGLAADGRCRPDRAGGADLAVPS